ncbi:MAG: methyltransferase domain-containing protein [Candidatus Dadabacteria bacterium]|nr:MAG: methyltransferase domain-containing protein [Candidatus Dadabacteria bacterium]
MEQIKEDLFFLTKKMESDWDRRVALDYRFWMSDGYESDEVMWQTGRRDLELLCPDIKNTKEKILLEIGCGVGRIIAAAKDKYKRVIGIDVSRKAVEKGREFLKEASNVHLIKGDGTTLRPVPDNSVDLVISFAALSCMPAAVMAKYLVESNRVLKNHGRLRIQIYLGETQQVRFDDTLHIRCYEQNNFVKALQLAGFEIEWLRELELPNIEVSAKELGINAFLCGAEKINSCQANYEIIYNTLLPEGEKISKNSSGYELEQWMALQYAKELAKKGKREKAKKVLHFVKTHQVPLNNSLQGLAKEIEVLVSTYKESTNFSGKFLEKNLKALQTKGVKLNSSFSAESFNNLETRDTPEGTVLYYQGQCLDHPTKPVKSAETWAERTAAEEANTKEIVIYGFASGYHIEELIKRFSGKVTVLEPKEEIFYQALQNRDLSFLIEKTASLVIGEKAIAQFCFSQESKLIIRPQYKIIASENISKVKSAYYGSRGFKDLHPRIAVLSPFYGGSLPIAGYLLNALNLTEQRHRDYCVSQMKGGLDLIETLIKDDIRQAIARGKYCEAVSQILLEAEQEKPIDILLCMAQAPITPSALEEFRKRGVITVLWFVEDYLRFTYWRRLAPYYDFIFTIQKGECIRLIKEAGAAEVHYLPLACDPSIHAPMVLSKEEKKRWGSDVSFVGAGYYNRRQTFSRLIDFDFKIWGTEWPECRPFDKIVQEGGRRLTPAEYVKIFNASTINLNLHSSTEKDGVDPDGDFVNPRTFEIAATGAFQLVDYRSLLPELFQVEKEIAVYYDLKDLREKIKYYLAHPEERERIAKASQRRVLKEHTYEARLKQMLSIIYSVKYESLKKREERSPWGRLLKRAEKYEELYKRCKKAFLRGEEPKLDGLVADITMGDGKLSDTEKKLLFLFHVGKQIKRMNMAEEGKEVK